MGREGRLDLSGLRLVSQLVHPLFGFMVLFVRGEIELRWFDLELEDCGLCLASVGLWGSTFRGGK